MTTRHERSVDRALDTGDRLLALFRALGSAERPGGGVMAAYRMARRALVGRVSEMAVVLDTLATLARATEAEVHEVLDRAAELGASQAERELEMYGLSVSPVSVGGLFVVGTAVEAVRAAQAAQIGAIRAMVIAGYADEDLVLGDEGRAGLLTPGPVLTEATRWIAMVAAQVYAQATTSAVQESETPEEYARQAIAAIDERTTDCCLRVHGQVVGLDEDFVLTGTPRFANRMHDPPFHWRCRTATALVRRDEADDGLTGRMQRAAAKEIAARSDGSREEIHPANAFSGRDG